MVVPAATRNVKLKCLELVEIALVDLPSSCSFMGPPTAGHPRFGRTRCCLHGTPEELGARSPDLAASQRSAAVDVGHGAGAGCCALAGAAPEFLELSKAVRC